MKSILVFCLFVSALSLAAAQVELQLSLKSSQIYVGDSAQCAIALVNKGTEPVVLVLPGDGSDNKMRTPFIGRSILPMRWPYRQHPSEPPMPTDRRECANINALDDTEVFTLRAGETRIIDDEWMPSLNFKRPGKYRMVFYYHNDPAIPFEGHPMTEDRMAKNPALRKMINSDKYLLRSNEVIIEVVRAPK